MSIGVGEGIATMIMCPITKWTERHIINTCMCLGSNSVYTIFTRVRER